MNLIKTGIRVTKTIRNVGRLKEIVSVLARNGFDEFLMRAPLGKHLPGFVFPKSLKTIEKELEGRERDDWGRIIGSRLRLSFEELGPAFVKLGQLLSSRVDLFDPSFISEMKALRNNVKGIPFEDARKAIEESLGKKIEDCFASIDPQPVGTASIGIVYKATLKDGTQVVLKLRRPGIERILTTDFSLLIFLVDQIEKRSQEMRQLAISRILRDFSYRMKGELNFLVEGNSCELLKKNLEIHDTEKIIHVPRVYKEYSSQSLLVMEYLDGISFNDSEAINEKRGEIVPKVEKAIRLYTKTFLHDGFFHADLHEGNFLYLKNGQIGLLDFGLMGHLSRRGRKNLIAILYAMMSRNYETLVYEFLDVAEYDHIPDPDDLIADIRDALLPFAGLSMRDINSGALLQTVLRILTKHQIYLPREWFIVFKALIVVDGAGKSLALEQDLFALIESDVNELLQEVLSKEELLEESLWIGKDMLGLLRMLPRQMKWFMKDFTRRGHAFEVINRGYEKEFATLSSAFVFLGLAFLSGTFMFAGVFLLGPGGKLFEASILSLFFWFLSFCFLVKALFLLRRKE